MGGSFLIGEVQEGYEDIMSQTALELVPQDSVEWTFPVQSLLVDGQELDLPIPTVSGSSTHVGLIDSGTSNILVPLTVVQAIYQQVEGAQTFLASPTREVWVLPCSAIPPSLTFVIGDQEIPIHPLDLNVVGGVYETAAGGLITVCFGGVIATEPVAGVFDFVLGTPFLRNVYSLFDYGNRINTLSTASPPTVRVLAVTNPQQAAAEFNQVRAAQLQHAPPASGDQIAAILSGSPDFIPVNPINPSLGGGSIDANSSSPSRHQPTLRLLNFLLLASSLLTLL
jgi:Eukaryotic aspartyl protease